MYPEELKKYISRGEIESLYFFYGENTYLINEAIEEISTCLFPSRSPGLDSHYYDAQIHDPSEIIQSARTVPFFSKKKLVVIKGVHYFKNTQWERFQSYFSNPLKHCCLVLIGENRSLIGKVLKKIERNGVVVSFANPRREKEIKEFISSGLKRHEKKITPDALNYLVENMAGDAQMISNELEKISLYCGNKEIIDIEDLGEVLSDGQNTSIFNLVEEIGHGNINGSLVILNALLDEGVYPLVIFKMIARQFRLISKAKGGMEKGESLSYISQKLELKNDYKLNKVKRIMQQAKGWSVESLGTVFEEIFHSNSMVKASSQINNKFILENLIFRLASLRDQPFA